MQLLDLVLCGSRSLKNMLSQRTKECIVEGRMCLHSLDLQNFKAVSISASQCRGGGSLHPMHGPQAGLWLLGGAEGRDPQFLALQI